jgi:hypothetical protein
LGIQFQRSLGKAQCLGELVAAAGDEGESKQGGDARGGVGIGVQIGIQGCAIVERGFAEVAGGKMLVRGVEMGGGDWRAGVCDGRHGCFDCEGLRRRRRVSAAGKAARVSE